MSADALLDTTLDALAHLIASNDSRRGACWPATKIEAFDGFEILAPALANEDDVILAGGANDAPVWPMDAKWAAQWRPGSMHEGVEGAGWLFKRVKTLVAKEWRGKLRIVLPRMYERHESYIDQSGATTSAVHPLGVVGNRLVDIWAPNHPLSHRIRPGQLQSASSNVPPEEEFDIALAHGIELRREYLWSVLFGEANVPRARFATDCIGVREAFRLRDIPPGRDRRAALRHWVRQHWRKSRDISAADRTWVSAHLRGAEEFGWQGMSCRIEPSREDVRKEAARKSSSR